MAVTIKDIAKEAGVSYSTVSRALNHQGKLTEKQKRIVGIANRMGYIPNQSAVNLKMAKSYTIGFFCSSIDKDTSPFVFHQIILGINEAVGNEYNLVVKSIDSQEPNTLNPAMFDGLLVLSQKESDEDFMLEAIRKKIPIVALNRPVYLGISNVLTDEEKGMKTGMEYLLANGHTKIGIIESQPELPATRARHRGWVAAVREAGMRPEEFPVAVGNYRFQSGYRAAKELLCRPLTAILCFNDEMAHGARKAILEMGLRVPEDVSLLGFDNVDSVSVTECRLTTIERCMQDIGRKGAEVLLDKIEHGNDKVERIYLENRLIIRESVKKLEGPGKEREVSSRLPVLRA